MDNEYALISIIIPVYNVEKYIEKCIQSLLDQTYENFEAIIVDDGSPDNSIKIAKELVDNDSRFIFLAKENGGQASARNLGLNHCNGDYIIFLDSDDYYECHAIEEIMHGFKQSPKVDILLFGFNIVDENYQFLKKTLQDLTKYNRDNDFLLSEEIISYSLSDKAYTRKVWENLRFIDGIIYEDKQIMPFLLYKKNLTVLESSLYNYVQRSGSTMHSYDRVRSVKSIKYVYQTYYDFLVLEKLYATHFEYYQKSYLTFCFFRQLSMIISYSTEYKKDCQYLSEQLDRKIVTFVNVKKYYGLLSKQSIAFVLFKISPLLVKKALKIKLNMKRFLNGTK